MNQISETYILSRSVKECFKNPRYGRGRGRLSKFNIFFLSTDLHLWRTFRVDVRLLTDKQTNRHRVKHNLIGRDYNESTRLQGRRQEFTKGQTRESVPSGVQGQNMESL